MKKILHGHHAGQIRKHDNAIIGAGFGGRISQRRHALRIIQEIVKPFDARSGRCAGGALGNRIDTNAVGFAQVVTKTTGDGFQQGFGIGHIVVIRENPLSGDIGQGQDGGAFGQRVGRHSGPHGTVKRHGRYVQGFVIEFVIEIGIGLAFADIGGHPDGMQDKINGPAQEFNRLGEQGFEVGIHRCIRGDDCRAAALGEFVDLAHAQCNGCVGENKTSSFRVSLFGDFPSDGLLIEGAKDDASFALQQ